MPTQDECLEVALDMELCAALFDDPNRPYLRVADHWRKMAGMAELVAEAKTGIQATLEELSKAIDVRLNADSCAPAAPETAPHCVGQSRSVALGKPFLLHPPRS